MSTFHHANSACLLCVTTLPLFVFSCASLSAQQSPWEGCRAASKTEYESVKRDFLLQTSVGAYAMTGHWGRGTIGIATYSASGAIVDRGRIDGALQKGIYCSPCDRLNVVIFSVRRFSSSAGLPSGY